ncbi:DsrE family protein [Fervidobacterium pennivorans subsp. shakshaketiis]|uniref:DsrE family protein n=1 Tax=Fervidobacterium pennivorans TaxID=93466 RepID=UPI0002DB2EE6|nr:DsrE family protein [Fervidobacterium pennivorans]QIV78154.1 intracellular sulfur oxidation protein [Fervidobacterium pennivorans subsp. keratinolyticus]
MAKKLLFVVYQSPVGAIWVNEAFRTAFGMYGEDLEPAVLLMNEAVVAVRPTCKPECLGLLPISMVKKYLARYGTPVYVVKEDAERFKVTEIDPEYNPQFVEKSELSNLFHEYDYVIFM